MLYIPACRNAPNSATTQSSSHRIVCSFLPMYLFTTAVVGNTPGFSVDLLLPSNIGCPHDYELTTADARRLADADVVILSGGLETFSGEAIRRINPKAKQIEAWTGCKVIADSGDEAAHDAHDSHLHAGNPHVWLSPIEAAREVENIRAGLAAAYPDHAPAFDRNAAAFIAKLKSLQSDFAAARPAFKHRNIVTMHDAFAYLARDLDLNVVASITLNPQQEPPPGRVAAIVAAIKKDKVPCLFTEPDVSASLANTIAREAGVPARSLDPLTTATSKPAPDYYEQRMRANLQTLKESLQ